MKIDLNPLLSRVADRNLRAKITLSVFLPLVVILGSFTAIQYVRHREGVLTNLSLLAAQTGHVIETSLQQAMLSRDQPGLQQSLNFIGENTTLRVIYLMDSNGRVVFAPNQIDVGRQLDNRDETCQPCHKLPPAERPQSVVVTLSDGQRVFRSMNPIENRPPCQVCHGADIRLLGLLLTDISMAPMEASIAAGFRENLWWLIATILVTVIVANLAVYRFVVRRLEGLANAITNVGEGQLPPPLPETQRDEIGKLAKAFNVMASKLKRREDENLELSENLRQQSSQRGELLKRLITAQEDERKRVARELHDELGQALAGLSFQAKLLEHYLQSEPERAQKQLEQIRALLNQTSNQMYDLIMALRPSALDDLGLVAALRAHADQTLAGREIECKIEARGMSNRLSADLEIALYRIFQEALSNILRHAEASKIRISLHRTDSLFEGEISDNGRGFKPEALNIAGQRSRGFGLLGMQERVAQCGGQLEILSKPGSGTRIILRVPLMEITLG